MPRTWCAIAAISLKTFRDVFGNTKADIHSSFPLFLKDGERTSDRPITST
jgi:hypothetical protein